VSCLPQQISRRGRDAIHPDPTTGIDESPDLLRCHHTGYNHSGKAGQPNLLNGVMGIANAQRALYYIRIFGEFFAQQEYSNLVGIFGIMNEPLQSTIGKDALTSL
jgi:hypothetical protein